jgi:hypothetical protein
MSPHGDIIKVARQEIIWDDYLGALLSRGWPIQQVNYAISFRTSSASDGSEAHSQENFTTCMELHQVVSRAKMKILGKFSNAVTPPSEKACARMKFPRKGKDSQPVRLVVLVVSRLLA